MDYPAEWQGASAETIDRNAVSKILTLTSTYDHRIIQGAQSGDFLRDRARAAPRRATASTTRSSRALRIPYEPIRWVQDVSATHDDDINKVARVQELIHAYRVRGHLMADTDPLEYRQRRHPDLDITNHGLTLWDLDRYFATGGFGGEPFLKLRKILGVLRDSYCRTVGVEYMHIQDPEQRRWIQAKVEVGLRQDHPRGAAADPAPAQRRRGVRDLPADQVRRPEALLPRGRRVRHRPARPHPVPRRRGRARRGLHRHAPPRPAQRARQHRRQVLRPDLPRVRGQAGPQARSRAPATSSTTSAPRASSPPRTARRPRSTSPPTPRTSRRSTRCSRASCGPSRTGSTSPARTSPSCPCSCTATPPSPARASSPRPSTSRQLRGYRTGGTVHVVINNQVGFTTSPSSSRSSTYSTDVARMIQAPIFHVNGDDPEACVRVAELAYEFRQEFHKDVVIDMVCYRRRGHNEGDDPSMTQPLMYNLIEAKRSVRKLYTEALIGRGDITVEDAEAALRDYQQQLERVFVETKEALKSAEQDAESGRRTEGGPASSRRPPRPVRRPHDALGLRHRDQHRGAAPHRRRVRRRRPRASPCTPSSSSCSTSGARDDPRGRHRLGHGRAARLRLAAHRGHARSGSPARTAAAAPSSSGTRSSSTRRTPRSGPRCSTSARARPGSGSTTRCSPSSRRWASSTATRSSGPTRSCSGRRSSATSPTARRRSSTSSSPARRAEVGPALLGRPAPAARLRGPGPGPLLGPDRALPHDVRRGQHDGRLPVDAGVVLPPAAPPGVRPAAPPAHRLHPEVDAAAQGRGQRRRGLHDRHLPAGPARPPGADRGQVDRVVLSPPARSSTTSRPSATKREDTRTAILRVEQLSPLPGGRARRGARAATRRPRWSWPRRSRENQGAWPFIALNLPEAPGRARRGAPHRVVSRPASASPAAGLDQAARGRAADLVARAFDR